jgi:RAD51-like protein 3
MHSDVSLKGLTTALDRFQVSLVFDVDSAHDALETTSVVRHLLPLAFTSFHHPQHSSQFLLVIDTITPLLAPHLSAISSHGHALMMTFMRHLHSLVKNNSVTAFVRLAIPLYLLVV